MTDAINCFSCGRLISLSYLKRHGICSYCSKPLKEMVVEFPFGKPGHYSRGIIVSIGRINGSETRVRVKFLKGKWKPLRNIGAVRAVNSQVGVAA